MSCNHCSTASNASAVVVGAPEVEATWADNREHPKFCPTCHGFLRKDGGCTRCEGYVVSSRGQNIPMEEVESSAVRSLGYDAESRQAVVEFTSGQIYAYRDVPADRVDRVRDADSIGEAVTRELKVHHEYTHLGKVNDIAMAKPSPRPAWLSGDADALRAAVTPETAETMNAAEAGQALGRVFELADAGRWGGVKEGDLERLTALYGKADLSGLKPDLVTRAYGDLLRLGDARQNRELTGNLAGNRTAPPETLRIAAEEIAFDGRQKDALALANNPNLDTEGQRILAASPAAKVRTAVASSPRTAEAVLNDLAYDNEERVALASVRNENSPHHQAVADGKAAKISDAETLRAIRKQGRSWRDMPRCGGCGAWTKADGVCNSKRCGGFGRQMAEARGWPPQRTQQGLGIEIPSPMLRRLQDKRIDPDPFRKTWAEAQAHGKFPAEWRKALPGTVSALAATGRWETPSGSTLAWDAKAGAYCVDGVPVPADNAGAAVRTYFALLGSGNEQTVADGSGGTTIPRWRYSEGYDALVAYHEEEPDMSWLQGRSLDGTGLPDTPPALPKQWQDAGGIRGVSRYITRRNTRLNVHNSDSRRYAWLNEGDDFQVDGGQLKKTVRMLKPFTPTDAARPQLNNVWGLPPGSISGKHLDAPDGTWVAVDGFRMLVVAQDGDTIPYQTNVPPDAEGLLNDRGPVTLGQNSGLAFEDKDGRLMEVEQFHTAEGSYYNSFPDVNQIIPANHDTWPGYRITASLPKEFVSLGADTGHLGRVEAAENGDLYMVVMERRARETDKRSELVEVGRQKIGELAPSRRAAAKTGLITAVNMKYFNDMVQAKPSKGDWELRLNPDDNGHASPIVAKHSSDKALGVIMPMHLNP